MIDWILKTKLLCEVPDRLTNVTSWHTHTPFAFWCVETLRPRTLVELGTHRGDSYSAFCQAVDRLRLPTRCYAVDTWRGDAQAGEYGDEVLEELRQYHDPRYGGFSRLVRSTFDEAVTHFEDGSIDLLHIDGFHTYEAVRHDHETWAPKLSSAAVVLFHDVNVREAAFGVWRLWEEVTRDHPSFTFHHGHGLGVLVWGSEAPEPARRLAASGPEEAVEIRNLFAHLGEAAAARGRAAESEVQRRRAEERVRELSANLARERDVRAEAEARREQDERLAAELRRQVSEHERQVAMLRESLASVQRTAEEIQRQLGELQRERSRSLTRRVASLPGRLRHAVRVLFQLVAWTVTFQLGVGLRRRENAKLIRRALLFDPTYYLSQLRDPSEARDDPLWHYLRSGPEPGLDPNPFFQTSWYLEHNPDVAASGEDPLVHYIRAGAREGRATGPRFDTAYYVAQNPEVRNSGLNPLAHYLRFGTERGLRSTRAVRGEGDGQQSG